MVRMTVCVKCGNVFEQDTASNETLCPQCQNDQELVEQMFAEDDLDTGFVNDFTFYTPNCGLPKFLRKLKKGE